MVVVKKWVSLVKIKVRCYLTRNLAITAQAVSFFMNLQLAGLKK
jgi:hypothetical protein